MARPRGFELISLLWLIHAPHSLMQFLSVVPQLSTILECLDELLDDENRGLFTDLDIKISDLILVAQHLNEHQEDLFVHIKEVIKAKPNLPNARHPMHNHLGRYYVYAAIMTTFEVENQEYEDLLNQLKATMLYCHAYLIVGYFTPSNYINSPDVSRYQTKETGNSATQHACLFIRQSTHEGQDKEYLEDMEKSVLKDFKATWDILYLHSAFNLSVEQLAERYQRSANEVSQLIESAKRLQAEQSAGPHPAPKFKMKTKKLSDGTEIQLLCPSQPRTAEDKALAEQLILGAHKLKLENPDLYHAGLALYHKHAWRTRYHLVFKSHESKDAQRFLDFLKDIGLSKEQIELSLLHGQKAPEEWIKNGLSAWKKSITKSHRYKWKMSASTDGITMGTNGWLGINVLNNSCNEASSIIPYIALSIL